MYDGWLTGTIPYPSPNFDARPSGTVVDLLVIHNISLPPNCFGGRDVLRFFLNDLPVAAHPFYKTIADLKVSSHFFINRQGEVWQLVSTEERAWHAGISSFEGREACNDFSIGIELEGSDFCEFTLTQYQQLAKLTRRLKVLYPKITKDRIVGHSDIASGRKTDPGPYFDWLLYHQLTEDLL